MQTRHYTGNFEKLMDGIMYVVLISKLNWSY